MNETAEIYRLAKPKKKGILPLIFSRFLIIVLLILLQIVFMVLFYAFLEEYSPLFSTFIGIFQIAMIIYLFNCSMDSSAKLTWMFILAAFPIAGASFLFFTQSNMGHRQLKLRVMDMIDLTRKAFRQDERVTDALEADGSGLDDLSTYLNRSGCFPVYDGTEVRYFPLGEQKFEAMLEELKKAERFIFMEYFIIEEGYMWGEILKILEEKVRAGVEVRVMYDGMC